MITRDSLSLDICDQLRLVTRLVTMRSNQKLNYTATIHATVHLSGNVKDICV